MTDVVEDHKIDKNGDIVATGYFENTVTIGDKQLSSRAESDIFVYKTNTDGTVLWAKTFGGPVYDGDVGLDIDDEGNIYIAGGFVGELYFEGALKLSGGSRWNSFLAKLDTNGDLIWIKGLLAADEFSEVRVFGKVSVNNSGIAVAGNYGFKMTIDGQTISNAFGSPGNNLFIVKFDHDGNLQWLKNPASDTNVEGRNILLEDSGDLYLTGAFTTIVHFDAYTLKAGNDTHSDIFLVKMDSNGNTLWAKGGIKTTDREDNNWGNSVTVDSMGNVFVVGNLKGDVVFDHITLHGNASSDYADRDGFIAKYNTNGDLVHATLYNDKIEYLTKVGFIQKELCILGTASQGIFYSVLNPDDLSSTPTFVDAYGYPGQFSAHPDQSLYISGYMGVINLHGNTLQQQGGFDGFLLKLRPPCNAPRVTNVGSIQGETHICVGISVQYSIEPVENAEQYIWNIPTNFEPNGQITTKTPQISTQVQSSGIAEISVSAINVCGISGAESRLEITTQMVPSKPILDLDACRSRLTVSTNDPVQWYFNNDLLQGENGSKLSVVNSGIYHVRLENSCGVIKSDDIQVYALAAINSDLPNVITPNYDRVNDYFIINESLIGSKLEVFNRWGKSIYISENYENNWDAPQVSPGVYFYIIQGPCLTDPLKGWLQIFKDN